MTLSIRDVYFTVSADGNPGFSFNFYASGPGSGVCNSSYSTESDLIVYFRGALWFADCENSSAELRSVLLPAGANGAVRVIYQSHIGSNVQLVSKLISVTTAGGVIGPTSATGDSFVDAANANANYGTGLVLWLQAAPNLPEMDSFVKFNFAIPSGSVVTQATLKLTSAGTGAGIDNVTVYEPSASWGETTITFQNKPPPISSSVSVTTNVNLGAFNTGDVLSVDATGPIAGVQRGGWPDNGLEVALQYNAGAGQKKLPAYSREFNGGAYSPTLTITYSCCIGSAEPIWSNLLDTDQFSATADADFGSHVVYPMGDGTVSYAFHSASTSLWTISNNIFSGGQATSPTITADQSNNDIYAFAIIGSSIVLRRKPQNLQWTDGQIAYLVTNRPGPAGLGSNFASLSNTNSSQILLVWRETNSSGTGYSATFASIPIQTVWSPYTSPTDPWDANGIAPYGQYFSNLGESVNPNNGMLTIRQTDLSIPGRGLNLELSRVYAEPNSFLGGNPYNFEGPYGFRDDTFTSGWTQGTVGTVNN